MIHMDKSSEIEREIAEDRRRIEQRIDAIQAKLSPGQMVDEVLAYARNHGGAEFATNLKTSAVANPLPVTLIGIGLAWLMAKPATASTADSLTRRPASTYPLATVTGEVRRSRSAILDGSSRYSHFEDGAGKRFRALSDETGRRAGHFIDESGNTFRGFADATGRQIDRIKDEAGNLLDEASGWAQRAWSAVTDAASDAQGSLSDAGRSLSHNASASYAAVQDQTTRFGEMIRGAFRDQPLVGGALAFAAGAAIGAVLPKTEQESAVMGEAASKIRKDLSHKAEAVLDKGQELASDAYETASAAAADLHDTAKTRLNEEFGKVAERMDADPAQPRHH
jgi:ElaB/YqjD/DUF883 family membrane-anchored ribosome-binding protein